MLWKDHYWHSVTVTRTRVEEIVRRVGTGMTVLDAGCNEGFLSQALVEAGNNVFSVDNDPEMIGKAKEIFGITALQADITERLPFPDGFFDVAVGGEVLEHLSNPGLGLSELFRVSKGRVIVSIPIGSYWLGEATHKWCIEGTVIEHDQGTKDELVKKVLVLEFKKR
jgi:2-polyprenyl-3-methyl-5-hydroxy-6-metoxy-1,4-benzoquinol methylase